MKLMYVNNKAYLFFFTFSLVPIRRVNDRLAFWSESVVRKTTVPLYYSITNQLSTNIIISLSIKLNYVRSLRASI